jgi:hypothetical protein
MSSPVEEDHQLFAELGLYRYLRNGFFTKSSVATGFPEVSLSNLCQDPSLSLRIRSNRGINRMALS